MIKLTHIILLLSILTPMTYANLLNNAKIYFERIKPHETKLADVDAWFGTPIPLSESAINQYEWHVKGYLYDAQINQDGDKTGSAYTGTGPMPERIQKAEKALDLKSLINILGPDFKQRRRSETVHSYQYTLKDGSTITVEIEDGYVIKKSANFSA